MIVGGPNKRFDYHINSTEEFYYQMKGDACVRVVDNGEFKDVNIKEGEMFLLPANIPHSPQRKADTIGLVIEQKRRPENIDVLRWYCNNENCKEMLHEESFKVEQLDLGAALKPIMQKFYAEEKLRTCSKCGTVSSPPETPKY